MDKLDKKKTLTTSTPHLLLPYLKGSCAAKDSDKSSFNDQSSFHCELQKRNSNGLRQKGKTLVYRTRKNRVGSGPQTQQAPGILMRSSRLSSFSFSSLPFPPLPCEHPPTYTHSIHQEYMPQRVFIRDIAANTLDSVKLRV